VTSAVSQSSEALAIKLGYPKKNGRGKGGRMVHFFRGFCRHKGNEICASEKQRVSFKSGGKNKNSGIANWISGGNTHKYVYSMKKSR